MAKNWFGLLVFALLTALGVATRLVPQFSDLETWNITATAAAALFAGFYFADVRAALLVPMLTMATADLWLESYHWPTMLANYAAMAIAVLFGSLLKNRATPLRIAEMTVLGATVFHLLSNLVAWPSLYPLTAAGLAECYMMAIPFYLRTLAGDLAFSAILFGAYFLAVNKGWLPMTGYRAEATVAS
jgi:hypothetical protein